MSKIIAVLVWSLATAAFAQAGSDHDHDLDWGWGNRDHDHGPLAAPEIDPASAVGALTLLAGGLAVVRGRRGKNK